MGGGDVYRCPEPATLAAFVEGKLDGRGSSVVARHLVDCPECVSVAGEASRFLREEAEEQVDSEADLPHRRVHPFAASVAAALALVCCAAAIWWFVTSRDPLRRLRQAAATSPTRSIEPRLANFPYARFSLPRAGVSSEKDPEDPLTAVAEEVAGLPARDARAWHARGVAALLLNDDTNAVRCLETATRLAPADAAYWNDLAAAEIARDGGSGDVRALHAAITAADRAVAADPKLASAPFNRALASERLGLRQQAVEAYAQALRIDPQSGWAAETRRYLRRLQQ
jgi:tetratricopeptide (TPR) repeat protein